MIKISIIEKVVHEWSNEDGEGNYAHTVHMNTEECIDELTVDNIAGAINDMLYLHDQKVRSVDVKEFIEFMEDTAQDFFNVAIIENGDSEEDIDGNYICDYLVTMESVKTIKASDVIHLV